MKRTPSRLPSWMGNRFLVSFSASKKKSMQHCDSYHLKYRGLGRTTKIRESRHQMPQKNSGRRWRPCILECSGAKKVRQGQGFPNKVQESRGCPRHPNTRCLGPKTVSTLSVGMTGCLKGLNHPETHRPGVGAIPCENCRFRSRRGKI